MGRFFYAIPQDKVGQVPCVWTEGCENAATHVDEKTLRTVCPPCYEHALFPQGKKDVLASVMQTAIANAQEGNGQLHRYADRTQQAARDYFNRQNRRHKGAEKPLKQSGGTAGS